MPRGKQSMEMVAGAVVEAGRRYDDPMIVVAGDFNQWKIQDYLDDFPELQEHGVGPTRGQHSIDRIFSNLQVEVSGTVPPLETDVIPGEEVKKSNHKIAFIQSSLTKVRAFERLKYSYRYYNKFSELKYGEWLARQDWEEVRAQDGSNNKANEYQRMVVGALEECFPLVTVTRKSTDPPWYNAKIRRCLLYTSPSPRDS